jgi:hypothetical protein
VAWFSAGSLPTGVTVNAAGGSNGFALETNASVQYVNPQARNATAGAAGASLFDLTLPVATGSSCATAFSLDAVRLSALALPNEVNLSWQLPPNMHFEHHTLERAELGEAFMPIGEYAAGNLTYWHADQGVRPLQRLLYRVVSEHPDGSKSYSNRVQVNTQPSTHEQRLDVYPNPSLGAKAVTAALKRPAMVSSARVYNSTGAEVYAPTLSEEPVTHLGVPTGNLPAGVYVLEVVADGKPLHTRFMVLSPGK